MAQHPEEITPLVVGIAVVMRDARERLGLTVRGAAKLAGVGVSTITRVEGPTRVIKWTPLRKLADAYGLQVSDVIEQAEEWAAANPEPPARQAEGA